MGDLNLLQPIAVFEQFFEQKIRLEDRKCLDFGEFKAIFGVLASCQGSALVKVGKTQVVAGVKVKVLTENSNIGQIKCTVEYAGLANRNIRPYTPQPKNAHYLTSKLQGLIENYAFPSIHKQLNIFGLNSSGKPIPTASYFLKLDILILHDDGCLLDACVPAACMCLNSARWPKLNAVLDNQHNATSAECIKPCPSGELVSISIKQWPVTLTYCFLPNPSGDPTNKIPPIIAQPTRRELEMWDNDAGPVVLTLSSDGNILDISAVNAFRTGLWDVLNPDTNSDDEKTNIWKTLLDSALSQAQKVEKILRTTGIS